MEKLLSTSVRYLKGIGPKRAKSFNKAGISTIEDLLYYFPRRYEDRTNFLAISKLQAGQHQTIKARVLARGERKSFRRRGFSIVEAAVGDGTGKLFCVWFNQPYLADYFKVGTTLVLYGKTEEYAGRLQMSSPEFEIISGDADESLNIGRIVPVYSLPEGLTQRSMRQCVKSALDEYLPGIGDFLPYDARSRNSFLNLAKSIINIHFPDNLELKKQAYQRLAFEEFFLFQLPLALRKLKKKEKLGIAHKVDGPLAEGFIARLPFKLTAAQERVIAEIKEDMARPQAMQRLLQGDVGSGKTVVATIASLLAVQGGYQAAFMAPTEVLARQHYDKISHQVTRSPGHQDREVKIILLTSGATQKEKDRIYQEIKQGKVDLVIGTHSLLEQGVQFKNLGLVVIDEQHKFGVGQRALLPQKGPNPDVLIMTATPIPRTLAITLYGDLDISVISELPAGRLPVKTLHFSEKDKLPAYNIAKEQLRQGHQAYIVYPVIEESYALDIAGAKKMHAQLAAGEFKEFRLGLIHGRLKQKEQDRVMLKFKERELDALVSTTVLEVGIDIANATCMIVEHSERFGLAQLHQLRGRVGRGLAESFCLLISDAQTQEARARLAAMVKYHDGFQIAEEDLRIRGPGEFFGRRQHGLTELKIANPLTQMQLLKLAREEAAKLVQLDPRLEARPNGLLREKLLQRFPEYDKLMVVG
ncbi:MAG: ATP-dependent DNA helicase RecG [Candidatus Omnitrophica bacterium]|nr:ATP-dependent DNA helicase RecG [Candidatus Omnitrophota bacterium]